MNVFSCHLKMGKKIGFGYLGVYYQTFVIEIMEVYIQIFVSILKFPKVHCRDFKL